MLTALADPDDSRPHRSAAWAHPATLASVDELLERLDNATRDLTAAGDPHFQIIAGASWEVIVFVRPIHHELVHFIPRPAGGQFGVVSARGHATLRSALRTTLDRLRIVSDHEEDTPS